MGRDQPNQFIRQNFRLRGESENNLIRKYNYLCTTHVSHQPCKYSDEDENDRIITQHENRDTNETKWMKEKEEKKKKKRKTFRTFLGWSSMPQRLKIERDA